MRICSLLPTATEMLYALGLGSSVVARSQHCIWPPPVKAKPIVVRSQVKTIAAQDSLEIHRTVLKLRQQNAHQFTINLAALRRLKPDLVITQNLCSVCAAPHSEVFAAVKQLSPRPQVISLQAQKFNEIFTELKHLGMVTARDAAADRLVQRLQERIAHLQERLSGAPSRPSVFCCEWLEPLMASGHWIPEMVEMAQGIDGLGKPGENSVPLSWERIRSYDPDLILVMPCSYSIAQTLRERQRLARRPGWRSLQAVKAGRVFAVDGSLFHHAGPRLVEGLELFAHLIHPDLIPDGRFRRYYRPLLGLKSNRSTVRPTRNSSTV